MKQISVLGLIILPFFGAILAVILAIQGNVSVTDIVLLVSGAFLTQLGVTVGFHRMVVHNAFDPHPVFKAIILALGSMTFQGPVLHWASVHTKHHAYSDQDGDPHSPIEGFIHSHFEWMVAMKSPELEAIVEKWGGRYKRDPIVLWFAKTFVFWAALSLIIPFGIGFLVGGLPGAWTGLLWGGLIRLFVTSHVTWCVNSVCHTFGARMFRTTDKSTNNPIIGLLALGEGWHNNHHAFPASAFHGLRWWQIDIAGYTIRLMEALGVVKKVVRIRPSLLEKRRIKPDGTNGSSDAPIDVQSLPMTETEVEPVEEA